ncbi:unnamed protein product, partial [Didymodactylos carnosus]
MPIIALLRTMNEKEQSTTIRWLRLSRINFFLIICTCSAIYYWLPGYTFLILTVFSWICYIKQKNVILAQVTGYNGLGMGAVSFDWQTITTYIGSPILVPRWAMINLLIGFVFFIWIFVPVIYYSNLWNFQNLPISSTAYFTSDGQELTSYLYGMIGNSTFYERPTSVFLSATSAVANYMVFASLAALFAHTILYHGKDIFQQFNTSLRRRENDIHCTLMAKYAEAHDWWYMLLFAITFILSAIACHFGEFMPWYYLFVAVPFTIICVLPVGIVQATTNLQILPDSVAIIIGATIFKNNLIALLTFAAYSHQMLTDSLSLLAILKFGHYMKISSRSLFITQLLITIISVIIRYTITNRRNIPPVGYFPSWIVISFIFNTVIRQWWWERYALLFSVAMDVGVQITYIAICILLAKHINYPTWWGTSTNICALAGANFNG